MQIVTNTALISINATLVVQLITFLVFLFIIKRVMFRPLQKTISERDTYMTELREAIMAAEQTVDVSLRAMAKKQAAIRTEASAVSHKLEAAASKEAEDIFEDARQEIVAMHEKSRSEIDAQIRTARNALQEESERLTVAIMEKVLERRIG